MLIIVGRNHTPFSGCQVFCSVEAEDSHVRNTSNPLTFILCAVSLSGVLDNCHTLTLREIRSGLQVRRQSKEICRNNRLCLPSHNLLNAISSETKSVLVNIRK